MSKSPPKLAINIFFLAFTTACLCFGLFSKSSVNAGFGVTISVDNTTDNNALNACTSAPNDCSLRGAIFRTVQTSGDNVILFDSTIFSIPQVITLTNGELLLDHLLQISGPGARRLTISGNHTSRIFRVPVGGSVQVTGLTLTNGNGVGGGQNGEGGAIFNQGSLQVIRCHIRNSIGTEGGGVRNHDNGTLSLDSTTISDNTATSPSNGGGINSGLNTSLTIINSTISGNLSTNGGGLFFNSGTASVLASTITNNTVTGTDSASGVRRNAGTVTVRNSIIAGGVYNESFADVAGTFVSNGFNLIGNRGSVTNFNQVGDKSGTSSSPLDPGLYPLQDNGGTGVPVHALQTSSGALDQGNIQNIVLDQRLRSRPFNVPSVSAPGGGDQSDIGAVEMHYTFVVTNGNNDGANSLRQVIARPSDESDVIINALNGTGVINLTGGEINIGKEINIIGPGADLIRVVGTSATRVFNIGNFPVTISGLTISNGNVATEGGGIRNLGNLVITACHITNNHANGGGGIANLSTLTLVNSSVTSNTANFDGGGIHNFNGNATLINTTVSGNTGGGDNAAGIFNGAQSGQLANLTVFNSTITGNSGGRAITNGDFGGATIVRTRLSNSIIAGNQNQNFGTFGSNVSVETVGYNLESDGSSLLTNNSNGDLVGTIASPIDARLGPLSTNGGPTPNHALLGGSPAIDKGKSLEPGDQRHLNRSFDVNTIPAAFGGDNSDIGAVEMQALIVTNLNDSGVGSLRSALIAANSNGDSLDDILFDNTIFTPFGTINMAGAFPTIATNLTINGPSPQLLTVRRDTGGLYRIFTIAAPFKVNINGLTMRDGVAIGPGGGAIWSEGKLSLSTCVITNNRKQGVLVIQEGGGGVRTEDSGVFDNCTFSGNVSHGNGGAISFLPSGFADHIAHLQVINCTISGNRAAAVANDPFGTLSGPGGGIFSSSSLIGPDAVLEIVSSTIVNNTATTGSISSGGIVTLSQGNNGTLTTILRNSIIAHNSTPNFRTTGLGGAGAPTFSSQGYNLTNENSTTILNQPTDQVNVNPLIRPLTENGGTTPTHALLAGSPALDRGNSFGHTRDQRSSIRPFDIPAISPATGGDNADIGAYEASANPAVATTLQFSAVDYNANESAGRVDVTITRSGDTSNAATVSFSTGDLAASQACSVLGSSASSRCDYETTLATLNFAAAETSKTVSILLIDDSYQEAPEFFTASLSNPSGATLANPANATITINDNDNVTGPNPIDTASFFVRQHYFDFLNREPDASGLAFWINEITSCGTNPTCIEVKRINVSAAFYLSIEFQETGYLIVRLYKTGYGDGVGTSTLGGAHQLAAPIVTFKEFLLDTQEIGKGLIVGQPGWEAVLENNKQAFANVFVQRARFTTAFPTTLTPAQFVDQLFVKAGVTPSVAERQAAIDEFGGSANTTSTSARARALRRVAEHPAVFAQEFNRSFVLMQYFGYLRRGPNESPDIDFTGYDFWLTKLNEFNGNFVNAEMVKAFILSGEYRHRFGP